MLAIFAVLSLLAARTYSQTYTEWVEKSYELLEKNELEGAEESLREAMRLEPGNPNNYALLTNLGTIQRQQGKYNDAEMSYTAALSRQPENVSLLDSRISLYIEMGEVDKAIIDLNVMTELAPLNEEAFYTRGLLYLQQKNFILAEADFERILEINDKTVRGRLGYAILEKMRGNYDESERIYNYLISQRPRDWNLYEGRADLYFLMGKNARAIADINRVFTESEPSAALYVLRGKIRLSQYDRETAHKDFRKALEMGYDPKALEELLEL